MCVSWEAERKALETVAVKAVMTESPELPQNKQDAYQQRKSTKNPASGGSGRTLQGHLKEAGR